MRLATILLPLGLLVAVAGGCGDDSSGPGGSAPMTAKIDGAAFQSNPLFSRQGIVSFAPGAFVIAAHQTEGTSYRSITISLANIAGPGTYPLGVGPTVFGGSGIVVLDANGWGTPLSGDAGSITITTLSTTQMVGTFSFVADASTGGATGVKSVTEGAFDVPIVSGGNDGPPAEHLGGRVTGMIDGVEWAAATNVSGNASGAFILTASNNLRTVSISVSAFTPPDTFDLSSTAPFRLVQVLGPGNAPTSDPCCWNALAGNTGTITIATATATRVTGSVSALLAPSPGSSATTPLAVELTFDVGLPQIP